MSLLLVCLCLNLIFITNISCGYKIKRIHVSSMESRENRVLENRAKPLLYSHTLRGLYCKYELNT